MYVILVNDDDTLYGSHKERIMQRSKLVENLVFVVDPIYRKTHDMTDASVMLEYVLPVSRKYDTINLVLSEERYKDCYLQYKLPFDTNLTSEAGSLEMQLTFAYVEMDENGTGIQRVRKTSPTTIEVIPISAWSDIIPDSALSALDQRILKQDAQIRALADLASTLDNNQVDNLVYDNKSETLQLSAKGMGIGDKVSVRNMIEDGFPVVDLDSNSGDNSDTDIDHGNGCDCGCDCGDNVVEFGNTTTTENPNKEDDNVVEFD